MRKTGKWIKIAAALLLAAASVLSVTGCKREVNTFETVVFGAYEQDGKLENGMEPLEWIVLERTDDSVLLTTKYGIFVKRYYTKNEEVVSWQNSSVRYWLENSFKKSTFSTKEQTKLIPIEYQDPTTGKKVGDYVTLLTLEEVYRYFPTANSRLLEETPYAHNAKAYRNTFTQSGWWWLKDMGTQTKSAAYVNSLGNVKEKGNYVIYKHALVRPVVRVSAELFQ